MRILIASATITGLAFLALACGQPEPTATISPTPAPTTATLSTGQQLFAAKGCAACHGQNAEGSSFAPPLAGHAAAVVKRQIRAPLGIMPVFPPDKVSNEEMDALSVFIGGLGGEHKHVRDASSPDEMALHHWMALFSIEAGDPVEGAHHLGHIVDLTEGEHLAQMKKAIALLEEGDTDEGARIVERMLAGLEEVGLDVSEIHLTLALSSARVEETGLSIQHVQHFLDLSTGQRKETAEEILALLRSGDVQDAVSQLEALLGQK